MLHYGMQHAPMHDGLNEPLSSTDAGSEVDYSHWLQLSSPSEAISSVQGHSQATAQAFVQDAYNAQESVYYAQATQAPATPVFDAQDQYTYYVYTQEQQQHEQHEQHQQQEQQEQDGQEQQEQRQQSHFQYLEDDQSVKDHMISVPDGVYSIYTQYPTPEPQLQMPMFSTSTERPPQPVTSQPPALSTSRNRGYQSSTNPLRPSRLRQVSNYEDDMAEVSEDHAAASTSRYDDHLAATTLVPQPSDSLAFALESSIKMEHVASTSSLSHGFQSSVHPLVDASPTDISVSELHSAVHSQHDSLYEALFSSADVAPIVTTHEEAPVENLWVADSDVVGSSAMDVDSLPAPPNFSDSFSGALSVDSALAGAVMDEFDTPEPLVTSIHGAVDGATADTDADADGETETGSPLPPVMEASTSNISSASNALTAPTFVDDDYFTLPQTSQHQLEDSLEVEKMIVKKEHVIDCVPAGVPISAENNDESKVMVLPVASDEVKASSVATPPVSTASTPSDGSSVASQTPPLMVALQVEPSARDAAAAANVLLALAAPTRHPVSLDTFHGSSSPIPFVAAVAHKRGAGGKRKRGSATSSPARSRVSSPMPPPIAKQPRRRFFAPSPIAFHIGPIDDVDPRTRLRHGTRGNKLVGIDAENQLEDKDRDHDLFIIRGGIFDLVPNGSRIRGAANRSGSRAKGAENAGPGSTSTSRAGSVAGSSPAPGTCG